MRMCIIFGVTLIIRRCCLCRLSVPCSTLDVVAENTTEWEAWIMALGAVLPCQPEFGTSFSGLSLTGL